MASGLVIGEEAAATVAAGGITLLRFSTEVVGVGVGVGEVNRVEVLLSSSIPSVSPHAFPSIICSLLAVPRAPTSA